MADDKKVFDVAKPGSSKPDTGSKPMVVGHKLMKDPTLTDTEDEQKEELMPQTNKITLNPISQDKKTDTSSSAENSLASDQPADPTVDTAQEVSQPADDTIAVSAAEQPSDSPPEEPEPTQTAEQKQQSDDIEQVEQEENLQRIIKEKTYYVPIEEASYSAFKTFIKTFFVVGILGVVIVLALIDAEIIDLGVELPFDFL